MPGFDGTGPMGQGAMTGGGRGYCAVALNSAGRQAFGGCGFYGRGGRGFRNCFYFNPSKDNELSALKNQAEYLKVELDAIQARVQDLETK